MLGIKIRVLAIAGLMIGAGTVQTATSDVKTVTVNETELSYVEAGHGQPLVFVHGSTNDYRGWEAQMAPFAKGYRVIAYSRRYHWPNKWSKDTVAYTMEQHAKDLAGLIKALGLKQVVLVGHSYGASVALVAAVRHPELISKLVLVEPLPMMPDSAVDSLQADREAVEERVRQAFTAGDSVKALSEFGNWFGGSMAWDQMPEAVKQKRLDNVGSFRLQANAGPIGAIKLSCDDLQKLTFPVLLVHGDQTKQLFLVGLKDIAACLPNVTQVEISKAGHGSVFQNPQEFNEKVLNFLGSH